MRWGPRWLCCVAAAGDHGCGRGGGGGGGFCSCSCCGCGCGRVTGWGFGTSGRPAFLARRTRGGLCGWRAPSAHGALRCRAHPPETGGGACQCQGCGHGCGCGCGYGCGCSCQRGCCGLHACGSSRGLQAPWQQAMPTLAHGCWRCPRAGQTRQLGQLTRGVAQACRSPAAAGTGSEPCRAVGAAPGTAHGWLEASGRMGRSPAAPRSSEIWSLGRSRGWDDLARSPPGSAPSPSMFRDPIRGRPGCWGAGHHQRCRMVARRCLREVGRHQETTEGGGRGASAGQEVRATRRPICVLAARVAGAGCSAAVVVATRRGAEGWGNGDAFGCGCRSPRCPRCPCCAGTRGRVIWETRAGQPAVQARAACGRPNERGRDRGHSPAVGPACLACRCCRGCACGGAERGTAPGPVTLAASAPTRPSWEAAALRRLRRQ